MTADANARDASVSPLGIHSLLLNPPHLVLGVAASVRGTVILSAAAPENGVVVQLFADQPESVSVPEEVRIDGGTISKDFVVRVEPVQQHMAVEITAALGDDSKEFAKLMIGGQPEGQEPTTPATTLNGGVNAEEVSAATLAAQVPAPVATIDPPGATETTQPAAVLDAPKPANSAPSAATTDSLKAADTAPRTAPPPAPPPSTAAAPTPNAPPSPLATLADGAPTFPDIPQSFRAAMLMPLPAVPLIGLVATLAVYAAPKGSSLYALDPVGTGIGVAIGIWLLIAIVEYWIIRGTSPDQVNNSAFLELRHRLGEIIARFAVANPTDASGNVAVGQLQDSLRQLRAELQRSSPTWIMGSGYISAWRLIHRAEEALLVLEPWSEVIRAGLYDELRLTGSQIDNSDQLLAKLRLAISRLSTEAASYLAGRPTGVTQDGTAGGSLSGPANIDPAALARVALREVRQTINEFRDNGWDAIVRTRNHLVASLTATGLATYLALVLAITINPQPRGESIPSNAVVAAGAFFLVGAMIGLFNRLNTESSTQNDVEDYGLTMVRLLLTPVIAGIAAVGGVFLAAMAASGVSAAVLSSGSNLPSMSTIFNLTGNPFALVLAAVFGLSPGMLIDGLKDQAEKYKDALKSTNPQGH